MEDLLKLHFFELEILRKLCKTDGLRFNQLLIDGLESEHMNYHLKKLVSIGYVTKEGNKYILTNKGKDYIGMLDDNKEMVEKQPKVSVLLVVRRRNDNGEIEHLVSRRLIQPYLGKVGRLTGKLRFGETIVEGALRELYEETGLKAQLSDCKVLQVYHKLRWNEDGTPVQDSIFFICSISNTFGDFISKTPVQENLWITRKELEERKDLDPFDGLELEDTDNLEEPWLSEDEGKAQGY